MRCHRLKLLLFTVFITPVLSLYEIPLVPAEVPETLFIDDFETGDFSKWKEYEPTMDSILSSGCIQENYCALRDFSGASYDAMVAMTSRTFDEAYFSFWLKLSPNFDFGIRPPHTGGTHFFRFYAPPDDGYIAQLDTGFSGFLTINFYMGDDVEYDYIIPEDRFKLDEWQQLEMYIKLNTEAAVGGKSNGILKFWVDGEIVIDREDAYMRGDLSIEFDSLAFTNFDDPYVDGTPYWIIDDIVLLSGMPDSPEAGNGSEPDEIDENGSDDMKVSGGCGFLRNEKVNVKQAGLAAILICLTALIWYVKKTA